MSLLLATTIKLLVRGFKYSKLNKSDIQIGQQLNLLPDHDNHHDTNAVTMKKTDGDLIGHMAKEFAPTFRKQIAFVLCLGVLIIALEWFEHESYNELLLELSYFVGDAQVLVIMHKTLVG